jgi:regulator of sirC expression with transglutaminase-like and TPR domain
MVKLDIVKGPVLSRMAMPLAYEEALPKKGPSCLTSLLALAKSSAGDSATMSPRHSSQFGVVSQADLPDWLLQWVQLVSEAVSVPLDSPLRSRLAPAAGL